MDHQSVPDGAAIICGLNALLCAALLLTRRAQTKRFTRVAPLALGFVALTVAAIPAVYVDWLVTESVAWAREAALERPNDASAQSDYANWLRGTGKTEEALAFARRARELEGDEWHYAYQVGMILLMLGRHGEALEPLEKAYDLQRTEKPPGNPMADPMREEGVPEEEIRRIYGDGREWARASREDAEKVSSAYAMALRMNWRLEEADAIEKRSADAAPDDERASGP